MTKYTPQKEIQKCIKKIERWQMIQINGESNSIITSSNSTKDWDNRLSILKKLFPFEGKF